MKFLAAAAFCLSCAVFTVTAQVVMVLREARPSSQNPRLEILSGGKLQPGANLAVYNADDEQRLSFKADSHGMATLPDLPAGRYCIAASTSRTLRAILCLQIADRHARNPSVFSIKLLVQPPPPPTFEEKLEALEKAPIGLLTRAFRGTVRDPAGAVMPRASVAVYRQGAGDSAQPLKITTDQQGHFSASLAPGKYAAVIESPGFETRFLTFEISPDAVQEDLHVKLDIGAIA
jgi:hypothetical protein